MLTFTQHKGACTGCTACMAACPVDCITMQIDLEGFRYPVSSDACINCGKCERICPVPQHDKTANHYSQKAYACVSKNQQIWQRSASGGAFSELCFAWGDDKTIVVGAAWDGLKVHHVCVEGVQNIAQICKSKYVASFPENTFREIRSYLKEGRKVIFCGTPCQVAGLKSFLVKDYETLLTFDLICHGVGSPTVFETAVHKIERQLGIHDAHYEFRVKRRTYEVDYITSVTDGNIVRYLNNDPYMQLFLKQNCLRPSCGEHCVFRDSNRQGDITIADFKGLGTIFPDLKETKRNYTAVITNSEKGELIISALKKRSIVREATLDNIKEYNPLFYRHTWFSNERDKFFCDFVKNPVETVDNWTKDASINQLSLKSKVVSYLPASVVRSIKKYLRNNASK